MGGGDRLIFASRQLWLVVEHSGLVVVSFYDLMRKATPLVWLVFRVSISRGGGFLFIGFSFGGGFIGSGGCLMFAYGRLWLVMD